jgi:hypothetical protein
MKTTVNPYSHASIPINKLPDGIYDGTWRACQVTATIQGMPMSFDVEDNVFRTRKCVVMVAGGVVEVEANES